MTNKSTKELEVMDIDWSKAPEGATHYVKANDNAGLSEFVKYEESGKHGMGYYGFDNEWWSTDVESCEGYYELTPKPQPKPVFTQAMADNGELPQVGMEFLIKNKNATESWAQPDFHPAKMKAIGDELFIIESLPECNGLKESVGTINDYLFKPIDTRTDKEKAVDDIRKITQPDKLTEVEWDIVVAIKSGKIHGAKWVGE